LQHQTRCEEAQISTEDIRMSRHKNPRLNPRNWEDLSETDNDETIGFEKLRHHQHESRANESKSALKPRQSVNRERSD
jgi:hypothetical protein